MFQMFLNEMRVILTQLPFGPGHMGERNGWHRTLEGWHCGITKHASALTDLVFKTYVSFHHLHLYFVTEEWT